MEILTERLVLRNWREEDRNLFREINRDPKVMEFFPFRRTHEEADLLMDRLRDMIATTGHGFLAMADRQSGEAMGFCGIAPVDLPGILPEGAHEIGWRLATRFWGKGFVTEAALALLADAFSGRRLGEVHAFAVSHNIRSIAVMRRIGMHHLPERDFDHPLVPDSRGDLKRHVLYRAVAPQR